MAGGVGEARVGVPPALVPATRPWPRAAAVAAYTLLLVAWSARLGIPNDTVQVFGWLWLGTVAWHVEAPASSHLAFLRDWWPPVAGLVVYFYSRGLTDELGFAPHVTMPITLDTWLGGGVTPTERLQAALCGTPCDAEWARWMRRFLAINFGALVVYVLYPMAPPWMAAQQGLLPGTVHRLTGRGWSGLGVDRLDLVLQGVGNPVAAMPSLHAGTAFLVALHAISRWRSPARWWLLAVLVLVGCRVWEDSRGS
jgi:PAP2 superfamily protein